MKCMRWRLKYLAKIWSSSVVRKNRGRKKEEKAAMNSCIDRNIANPIKTNLFDCIMFISYELWKIMNDRKYVLRIYFVTAKISHWLLFRCICMSSNDIVQNPSKKFIYSIFSTWNEVDSKAKWPTDEISPSTYWLEVYF